MARSIRLTQAFLRMDRQDCDIDQPTNSAAFKLRVAMMWIIIPLTFLAALITVFLLAHVDDGRRATQQLGVARAEYYQAVEAIGKLQPTDWKVESIVDNGKAIGSKTATKCEGRKQYNEHEEELKETEHHQLPESVQAILACAFLNESAHRQNLTFIRLAKWNCLTYAMQAPMRQVASLLGIYHINTAAEQSCGETGTAHPSNIRKIDWKRTEIRTQASMTILSGFVLPLLLGGLGGAAYALRRLDQSLIAYTLEVSDGIRALLRVLLASMLGGLLGLVWGGETSVHLGGVSLSLAAAAFFVGFSLEVVFTLIETMVEGFADKMRGKPPQPGPAGRDAVRGTEARALNEPG
jgi:hypothetical protein